MPIDRLICLLTLGLLAARALAAEPVLGTSVDGKYLDSYRNAVEPLLDLSEEEMLALIPQQSGIYFCDCVNCEMGRQEGQFHPDRGAEYQPWSIERPDVLVCTYCGHEYPSEQYPMDEALEVVSPRGEVWQYPYYEDADGYRHHFAARLDYIKIRHMERAANTFARLYSLTGDDSYARRSVLIMRRFAEVFPGYPYKFDYPFNWKEFYDGDVDPADFRNGFRTSRWSWWAYMDIPDRLVEAYDLVAASPELTDEARTEIEAFFTTAAEQVLANRDDLGNMSMGMWAHAIRAGRVLGRPDYVHTCVGRLRRLMASQFFYDGVWKEGAPSYHSQVIGNLSYVFRATRGYSDPEGYEHPDTGERFDDLDVERDLPLVTRSAATLNQMRLPNGRLVPVHDTWSTNSRSALDASTPWLLPALGHACLGAGEGDAQIQAHLTWSGGYGHTHYDGLSLMLFAHGKELLSDLGYTHTKGRAWTICTPSHNLVVVDHKSQKARRGEACTLGRLRYFDASNAGCQIVSVDNPEVYPETVSVYRRSLVLLDGLLVDFFQVTGGDQHDYLLHGSADEPQTLRASGPELVAIDTLVPPGVEFVPAMNEGEAGMSTDDSVMYGYLIDSRGRTAVEDEIATLEYACGEGDVSLVARVIMESGDELITGTNPAVRPAKEDDRFVDDHRRSHTIVRRAGGDSLFASVIEPVEGASRVASVTRVEIDGAATAIEIERASGRRDLLLLNAVGVGAEWSDATVSATADLVVLTQDADGGRRATVAAGTLNWGEIALDASPVEAELVAVDRDAKTLTVADALSVPVGSVVTLDHAGGRVSPYTVAVVSDDGTQIEVVEDPGIDYDADQQTSTYVYVPHTSYTGAHVVSQQTVRHHPGGE